MHQPPWNENTTMKIHPLVEKTEQKRRKKCSVCSVFYVRNGRHVRFVRHDRFQMKEIVGMFVLKSEKASVCTVLRDLKTTIQLLLFTVIRNRSKTFICISLLELPVVIPNCYL